LCGHSTDAIAVNEMKLAQSARLEIKQLCDFVERVLRNGAGTAAR
jgi:hypothetical protein